MNAVIGDQWFFTEHVNGVIRSRRGVGKLFKKVMANHAITNHDQIFLSHGVVSLFYLGQAVQ